MKYSVGNSKLGTECLVTSRAVGDTCPKSCQYLGAGCYAESIEKRFANARKVGLNNIIQDWQLIRAMLLTAAKTNKPIRLHERGDFLHNGKIDSAYIYALTKAIKSIKKDGKEIPEIWAYTHIYKKSISKLDKIGINIYASIHNKEDLKKAKKAGFKKFAYCDTDHKFTNDKMTKDEIPKYVTFGKQKYLVCPEQRLGRLKVTCSGSKSTTACNYCIKKKGGNVLFIDH